VPRRVVVAYWKNDTKNRFEIFSNLKIFCASHPAYNYNTLNKYLSGDKKTYENSEVRIERKPIVSKPVIAVEGPDLHKRLFWEFDYDRIDWKYQYRMVIERIIQRGTKGEWEEIIKYYSLEKVVKTLKEEVSYLPDYIIKEVCDYFNVQPQELKCYTRKQSMPQHWI
jgi:hypothetical protein